MQRINIDIETRCLKDLTKVGVYAYADDPSFKVLLFGYAIDGGPVNVIDLARDGKIPEDVMNALTDDSVKKWAFNAQFERVCIGKMIGEVLSRMLGAAQWSPVYIWGSLVPLHRSEACSISRSKSSSPAVI